MPKCPHCQNRLTLRSVMGSGGVVCPHCYSELEPQPWTRFIGLAGLLVLYALNDVLRSAGMGKIWVLVIAISAYIGVTLLLYARFAMFRLKKAPISILRG